MTKLIRDNHGIMRVDPLPTDDELAEHYRRNYFGGGKVNSYSADYDSEELEHKSIAHREALYLWNKTIGSELAGLAMLDVGCGEGFCMAGFSNAGWSVTGVDFTDDGVDRFNPTIKDHVVLGDIFRSLQSLVDTGRKFDCIVCNNLLEHVREPLDCVQLLRKLVAVSGLVRISVPNDGSWLQKEIVNRGGGPDEFWVAYPDHLSYFTHESLFSLMIANGWRLAHALSEYPVDIFLLNPHSNYILDPSRGKAAHRTRITFDVGVARQGLDKLVAFREGCARAGIGRNIVGYFVPV
jgi:2-polyprenyl-3-methyl-5-hydroxy-6-metoxy-1,4-benzoquinol methylase